MEVKVNQISSFQPTKLRNWKLVTMGCFGVNDFVYWVKSEWRSADEGFWIKTFKKKHILHEVDIVCIFPLLEMLRKEKV